LASGALALLGLAAADPDALIARYNIAHEHRLDLAYLQGLSDDAVPELMELSGEERECVLGSFAHERGERPLMAWNLGRQRAEGLLEQWEGERAPCASSPAYEDFGEDLDRSDGPGATAEDSDPTAAEGTGSSTGTPAPGTISPGSPSCSAPPRRATAAWCPMIPPSTPRTSTQSSTAATASSTAGTTGRERTT